MLNLLRSRRMAGSVLVVLGSLNPLVQAQTTVPEPAKPATPAENVKRGTPPSGFGMSPAVACLRVDGLEQYTILPEATLTNADKLKVYFRPLRYKFETDPTSKSPYHAKFVEDGRIRRKGDKTPLAKEDKLLEYETRYADADYQIYLVNTIGLESLMPGEYEFDITLHDAIDGQATARQTLPFKIVASQSAATVPATNPDPPMTKPAPARKAKAGRVVKKPG